MYKIDLFIVKTTDFWATYDLSALIRFCTSWVGIVSIGVSVLQLLSLMVSN